MKKPSLCLLLIIIVFTFSSCDDTYKPIKKGLFIYNKSYTANYGEISAYSNGKVYFEYNSQVYCLNPEEDIVDVCCKSKIEGSLFCVDSNQLYYKDVNNKEVTIYSSDMTGGSVSKVLNYKLSELEYNSYLVENNTLYFSSGELYSYNNNEVNQIDSKKFGLFGRVGSYSLFSDDNYFYIKDSKHSISGLYSINGNYFSPCNNAYPTILSYDKQSNKVYVYVDRKIYSCDDLSMTELTHSSANDDIQNLSVFTEDNSFFYIASKNKPDEVFRINKTNGDEIPIYKASDDENVLFIQPNYIITYRDGNVYKKYLDNQKPDQEMFLFKSDTELIELECCGDYLFAQNNTVLHVINLDSFSEIPIE